MGVEAVIGLEVHAQLATRTKLFCSCPAAFGAAPNAHVCPVCLGLPGALPVLNGQAVALALRVAEALGADIARRSAFARKNYFYPDLPKNYQITQYEEPLAANGRLEVPVPGATRPVRVVRLHLEEDAGKLVHDPAGAGATLVDLNRAGVPLLEIVTAPDLRGGAEAQACLARLRRTLLYLGACDGGMEEGSLRCDANVSVRPRGSAALGVKVEVKNVNSLRGLRRAIDHEAARQAQLLAEGSRVAPETRGWDADAGRTVPMRSKEGEPDYRYFPEPDLPPLVLAEAEIAAARAALPELPDAREARLAREWGLTPDDAALLTDTPALADYLEATARALGDGPAAAHWIATELLKAAHELGASVAAFPVPPAALAGLLRLVRDGEVSGRAAKEVFAEMVATGAGAADVVARRGLRQLSDAEAIRPAVEHVLDAHPREVAAYLGGKRGLLAFFVGLVLRETGGRASPPLASRLVAEALEQRRS